MQLRKMILFIAVVCLENVGLWFLFGLVGNQKTGREERREITGQSTIQAIAAEYDASGPEGKVLALGKVHEYIVSFYREVIPRIKAAQTSADEKVRKQGQIEHAALVIGGLTERLICDTDPVSMGSRAFDLHVQRGRLGNISGVGELAAGALAEALSFDNDVEFRREVVGTLGAFASDGCVAGPVLIKSLRDKDEYIRVRAALALGTIKPPGGVEALCETLKDPSAKVRNEAAYALGAYGKAALQAKPGLEKARTDPDPKVRATSEAALQEIEKRAALGKPGK